MKIFSFLAALCLPILAGCSDAGPEKHPADALFEQRVGGTRFHAKIAVTENEKMRGLMGVRELPENEGMIFVGNFPHMASFWMKNTPIPLDIAFVDPDGVVLQVSQMYPHSEVAVRSASSNVLYSIEMNLGWFAKNKIKAGDRIDIDLLVKAVEARRK